MRGRWRGSQPPRQLHRRLEPLQREVVEGVLEFPDLEPTPSEKAGGAFTPNEEACAHLVPDLTELGAKNWRSFLTRYEDEMWPTGEDAEEACDEE